jgi:hypothetical protein
MKVKTRFILILFVTTNYFQCHECSDYEITIFTATINFSVVLILFTLILFDFVIMYDAESLYRH